MKTAIFRIFRALLLRIIFMAYSLLCIWRVTYISENKFFWLMMISVGFMIIETAILVWLRAGKEFRGILPSVLFLLTCVIPSLWLISVDEASRKNRFVEITQLQEAKIKDYVLSLDIAANQALAANNHLNQHLNILNASSFKNKHNQVTMAATRTMAMAMATTTRKQAVAAMPPYSDVMHALSTFKSRTRHVRSLSGGLATQTAKNLASNIQNNNNNLMLMKKHHESSKLNHKNSSKSSSSSSSSVGGSGINADCCGVKISYLFQEDIWHSLFMQVLMLILVTSRWLITRSELNLNQRSLVLVISVATAADILDFFGYLKLNIVFRNTYLLYTVLFILSISLIQFVFLHIEENFNFRHSSSSYRSMMNNNNSSTSTNTSSDNNNNNNSPNDTDDIETFVRKYNQDSMKSMSKLNNDNMGKFPNIYKHYKQIKKKLAADAASNMSMSMNEEIMMNNNQNLNFFMYNGGGGGSKLASLNHNSKANRNKLAAAAYNQQLLFEKPRNGNNSSGGGGGFLSNLHYLFCCKVDRDNEPLFLILLVGLFLHDASFLTFRIFILTKLGWNETIDQGPGIFFFMIKNVFVIITQIYKVYIVTDKRKKMRLYEDYKDFMMTTNSDTAAAAATMNDHFLMAHQLTSNSLILNNNKQQQQQQQQHRGASPFYPQPLLPAAATHPNNLKPPLPNGLGPASAVAANQLYTAGGGAGQQQQQPPGYFSSQQFIQGQQGHFMNHHHHHPHTNNLFQSSIGSGGGGGPTNNPYRFAQIYADVDINRSLSTLGGGSGSNSTFFYDHHHNHHNHHHNQGPLKSSLFHQNSNNNNNNGGSIYFHPSNQSLSPSPYQQHDADSLLAVITKEFNNEQNSHHNHLKYTHNLTTPANPFTAKVGKALYGLPFLNSRSKTSMGGGSGGVGTIISAYNSNNNCSETANNNNNGNNNNNKNGLNSLKHHLSRSNSQTNNKMKSSKI